MAKKKVQDGKNYIYGAREIETGKLVSNLTNPRRKYWDREGNAQNAIKYHNSRFLRYGGKPGLRRLFRSSMTLALIQLKILSEMQS